MVQVEEDLAHYGLMDDKSEDLTSAEGFENRKVSSLFPY